MKYLLTAIVGLYCTSLAVAQPPQQQPPKRLLPGDAQQPRPQPQRPPAKEDWIPSPDSPRQVPPVQQDRTQRPRVQDKQFQPQQRPGIRDRWPGDAREDHSRLREHFRTFPGADKQAHRPADVTRGKPVAPVHLGVDRTRNYNLRHGHRFPRWHPLHGRYFYYGHQHHQWTWSGFDPRYGCNLYWCPWTVTYYYWCAPDVCYYPVDYVPYGSYTAQEEQNQERQGQEQRAEPIPPPVRVEP